MARLDCWPALRRLQMLCKELATACPQRNARVTPGRPCQTVEEFVFMRHALQEKCVDYLLHEKAEACMAWSVTSACIEIGRRLPVLGRTSRMWRKSKTRMLVRSFFLAPLVSRSWPCLRHHRLLDKHTGTQVDKYRRVYERVGLWWIKAIDPDHCARKSSQ
ncbi:hypothetical protein IF2G_07908 [Cordyceps javanica]|nr:hypothetical protein IF2G_07908 [Cordyceps javanica]